MSAHRLTQLFVMSCSGVGPVSIGLFGAASYDAAMLSEMLARSDETLTRLNMLCNASDLGEGVAARILSQPFFLKAFARTQAAGIMDLLTTRITTRNEVRILSQPGAMEGLVAHGQAGRMMPHLEQNFSVDQQAKILAAHGVVPALVSAGKGMRVLAMISSLNPPVPELLLRQDEIRAAFERNGLGEQLRARLAPEVPAGVPVPA